MHLSRVSFLAGLSFIVAGSVTLEAQTAPAPRTTIQPFVTLAVGPGFGQTGTNKRFNKSAGARPVLDATVGARKRLAGRFGLVVAANAGKVVDHVLGGDDLVCRVQLIDGKPSGCLPEDPLLDWYGVSAGGEAYLGRAILGIKVGPASFGTKSYERNRVTGAKSGRELGIQYQFDANFPVYRQLGITLSAVRRHVPSFLGDRMDVNSIGAGLTIGAFR